MIGLRSLRPNYGGKLRPSSDERIISFMAAHVVALRAIKRVEVGKASPSEAALAEQTRRQGYPLFQSGRPA